MDFKSLLFGSELSRSQLLDRKTRIKKVNGKSNFFMGSLKKRLLQDRENLLRRKLTLIKCAGEQRISMTGFCLLHNRMELRNSAL